MVQHALPRARATTRALIVTLLAGAIMAGAFLSLIVIGTRMASEHKAAPITVARLVV